MVTKSKSGGQRSMGVAEVTNKATKSRATFQDEAGAIIDRLRSARSIGQKILGSAFGEGSDVGEETPDGSTLDWKLNEIRQLAETVESQLATIIDRIG